MEQISNDLYDALEGQKTNDPNLSRVSGKIITIEYFTQLLQWTMKLLLCEVFSNNVSILR